MLQVLTHVVPVCILISTIFFLFLFMEQSEICKVVFRSSHLLRRMHYLRRLDLTKQCLNFQSQKNEKKKKKVKSCVQVDSVNHFYMVCFHILLSCFSVWL